jgi:hypothetical protein
MLRASTVAFGLLLAGAACTGPSTVGATTSSRAPTLSKAVPTPTLGPGRTLTGVPFATCAVTSTRADMNGDQEPDRIYVFSMAEAGTCHSRRAYVGLQRGEVGPVAFDPTDSLRCLPRCSVLAVMQLVPFSTPAVAVSFVRGFFIGLELFGLGSDTVTLRAFSTSAGKPVELHLGGTVQSMAGVRCTAERLISWDAAETVEGNGPYAVQQTAYSITNIELESVGSRRWSLPQNDPSSLPQAGGIALGGPKTLCGAPLIRQRAEPSR